jgi:hypothetical protein
VYSINHEVAAAIEDAAKCAGEFLDKLGKTNLATLSFDEWMAFMHCVCTEYDAAYENRRDAYARAREAYVEPWQSPPPPGSNATMLDDEIPF